MPNVSPLTALASYHEAVLVVALTLDSLEWQVSMLLQVRGERKKAQPALAAERGGGSGLIGGGVFMNTSVRPE